jgi:hypothetical protein
MPSHHYDRSFSVLPTDSSASKDPMNSITDKVSVGDRGRWRLDASFGKLGSGPPRTDRRLFSRIFLRCWKAQLTTRQEARNSSL